MWCSWRPGASLASTPTRHRYTLTPAVEAAARALAPLLGSCLPFARVFSSPLARARRTCGLAGFGDQMALDPDLVEWTYGADEGMTSAEIEVGVPGWMVFRDGCPQGERPEQVGARVDRLIARLREGPGPVLVVAHGLLLRVLMARWLDLRPSAGCHFLLDTATLNVLRDYRDVPALASWNAALSCRHQDQSHDKKGGLAPSPLMSARQIHKAERPGGQ